MMALPLMLLYEVSIIGARIFTPKAAENDDPEPSEPEKKD
jgi:Sec-independent protein secretion pathway component TatC